jgi:hypothetical protein
MDETTRDVIARWKRDFPMTHERPSTTFELANQLLAARDAAMESDLWDQVDAL